MGMNPPFVWFEARYTVLHRWKLGSIYFAFTRSFEFSHGEEWVWPFWTSGLDHSNEYMYKRANGG